jgi:hypothetical protein
MKLIGVVNLSWNEAGNVENSDGSGVRQSHSCSSA